MRQPPAHRLLASGAQDIIHESEQVCLGATRGPVNLHGLMIRRKRCPDQHSSHLQPCGSHEFCNLNARRPADPLPSNLDLT